MAIARITDIRGLVTLGENGEEILKNRDMISEHGGLLTINEFAKIIFDDGREIEVTGPVTFNLDESFFNEGTFEDSITQISDLTSLEYINNNLETIINNENLNTNILDQNQNNPDVQTEQLNSQINDTNNQLTPNEVTTPEVAAVNATENTENTTDDNTQTAAPETVDPVEVQINDISLVSLVEDTVTSGTKVADFSVSGGNIGSITLSIIPSEYFVISGNDILLTQEGANLVNSGRDLPTFSITASDVESGLSSTDSATLADTTDVDDGLTVTVNNVISSITEGDADTSTVVGNASSTNPDGSTITYTISDTTNYAIDPSTGEITLTSAGAKVVNDGGDLPNFTVSASSTTGDNGTSGEVNPADTTSTNVNPDAVDDGNITTETVTINTSNINDTNNGFTVTAQNADGTTGTLSSNSYGFGVSGSASGADSELGYKSGVGSEKVLVNFDENVSSVDVSFGWKASTENAVIKFYKDGVEVGSTTHYGGTDGIDNAATLQPDNGSTFDQVVFSAPSGGNHDYMINSISFNKITSDITTDEDTSITVDVLANDTDTNNDTLSVTQIQGQDVSSGQTVNVTQDGQIIGTARVVNGEIEFTPGSTLQSMNNGESENVSFEYTISDGRGGSDTASVNIKVTGSNEVDNTATAPTITASLGTESVVTTGGGNVDLSMDTWSGVDNQYDYTYNSNLKSGGDFTQNNDDIYVKNHIQTSVRTFNGDDEIYVGKNVTSSVNLGDGNNEIEIGNDLSSQLYSGRDDDKIKIGNDAKSQINSGSGDDTILVGNDAKSQIDTGDGDDKVYINNDLKSQLSTGDDNDTVKIGGDVKSQIDLGAGNDVIQVSGEIKSQIDGSHGTDSIILDNYTKADYDNNVDNLQTNIHRFENIKFSDGQVIGDSSAFDSIGSGTTTYEYPVNLSVTNNDADSETLTVKIVVENLPSGATISQNGIEISATNGNEYVLNANDLSNIKISSPSQIASDGAGGLKISVEATSTESNGGAEALQTAVLVDGVVEGAYYETSSGLTGYTDANGSFSFKAGDSVTFSVGGVVLGVATAEDIASGKTFLQDIADVSRTDLNDEYLENMAVFLQSIDTADSGDNIVITDAMHEALKDANIDLRTASEEEVKDLVESVGGTYVDEDDAMVHVKEMLQEYANMEENEFDQRVEDDNESAVLGKEPQTGVEYTTSSGVTGVTNENGEFEYNDGDSITFSKDGIELSTIESSAIGDDSLITMNELTSLNQSEIDVDSIELDFDNLASILDIESGESDIKDVDIDDLDIKDMLMEDGDNSLSTLLGEDDNEVTSSSSDDTADTNTNQESTEDEYCPFKTLEESSNGMMTNMDLEDNSTFHDE